MEKDTVEEAVYSAVAYFNDGASAVVKLFQCLGIEGKYRLRARKAKDTAKVLQSPPTSPWSILSRGERLSEPLRKAFKTRQRLLRGILLSSGSLEDFFFFFFGELMKFSLFPPVLEFPRNSIFDMVDSFLSTVSFLFFHGFT